MKIKTIRFNKTGYLISNDREVKGIIIMTAIMAASIIIGSGSTKIWLSGDIKNEFTALFDAYTEFRTLKPIHDMFFNSFTVNIIFGILIYLSGACCVGAFFPAIMLMIRSFGMGIFSGYLYGKFSITGIGYYMLTVLPGAVTSFSAMIISGTLSFFMSNDILAVITGKRTLENIDFRNFSKKYIIIFILFTAASLLDSILTKAFSYLFAF